MTDLTLGQRIAEARKKLGLSQEALGEKMGVSRQAISKWEADGAVPEIDKLIGLSRLFGVSVGWLLGVEEMPEQPKEELTETQLKMVEEIVRRYQPRPEKSGTRYRLALVVLVAVVGILAVLGLHRSEDVYAKNLFTNITSLKQDNIDLHDRLDDINARLEAMGEGAVLTGYKMELLDVSPEFAAEYQAPEFDIFLGTAVIESSMTTDFQTAFGKLSFTAVPQNRQEQDSAALAVFMGARQVALVPLEWNGSLYRTEFVLPVMDGYEYCFIQERDGTQDRQYLRQTGCADLEELAGIEVVVFEPDDILYDGDTLRIQAFSYAYYPPELAVERNWHWIKIDFVLYANGEEVARYSDDLPHASDTELISSACLSNMAGLTFETDALKDGDDIRLYIEMEMTSGISLRKNICFMELKDGKIEYTIHS